MNQVRAPERSTVSYRTRRSTSWIILHDTHTPPELPDLEVHNWLVHNGRRMGMLSEGYNAVIYRDGSVDMPRPLSSVGCHTPGYNHVSMGVALVGSGDYPEVQLRGLREFLLSIRPTYQEAKLVGHTELMRWRKRPADRCPAGINTGDLRRSIGWE